MSEPLVVIDADVLGRQRTGDETYVRGLLRELAARRATCGFAAVTRRPDLVPDGNRAGRAAGSQPGRAHGGLTCRGCSGACGPRSRTSSTRSRSRCPCPAVVTVHDLSFERDSSVMGAARPADLQDGRPPLRAPGRACARRLGADEARPDRALRHSRRRRSSSRRTASIPPSRPRARARTASRTRSSSARSSRARTRRPRSRRWRCWATARRGSSSSARTRRTDRRGASRRAERPRATASSSATTCPQEELAALYRGAACLVFPSPLRGLRPAAWSRRWPRARRSSRRPPARCRRWRATRRSWWSERNPVALAGGIERAHRRPRAARRRRPRTGAAVHLGRDGAPDARGLPVAAVSVGRDRDLDAGRPGSRPVPGVARAAGGRARARRSNPGGSPSAGEAHA